MVEELYPYFERELHELRRRADDFSKAHPEAASRLGMSGQIVEDPHVQRLLEGFAFLAARIHRRLDDDFPELPRALLGILQPHYLAPIPSMAIVQFRCQPDMAGSSMLPRHFALETAPVQGEPCRFRTAFRTELWPLEVAEARLARRPCPAPEHAGAREAVAVLRVALETAGTTPLSQLGPDVLRFHLPDASGAAYALHDLLCNDLVGVALATGPQDPEPLRLGPSALRPVGFEPGEALFDGTARSSQGYRLLSEYFALPQKFLFFEVAGLGRKTRSVLGQRIELYFFLTRAAPELEAVVSAPSLALGCTPVVNLFRHTADPITLNHRVSEYRVVPEERRPHFAEIHTVEAVTAFGRDGVAVPYEPFFALAHGGGQGRRYWHAVRRRAGFRDEATDVYLSLADLDFSPDAPDDATLVVETTCCNRDIPTSLPFGGGEPRLLPSDGAGPLGRIACLTRPTPTLRRHLGDQALWRLVSHLSLNHLCITGGEAGAAALREMLRLYDFRDSAGTRAMIEGLVGVRSRQVARRFRPGPPPGSGDRRSTAAVPLPPACQGTLVTLELDPARFTGSSPYLFGAVLDQVFGHLATINAFTQTAVTFTGHEGPPRTWTPRAGDRPLL